MSDDPKLPGYNPTGSQGAVNRRKIGIVLAVVLAVLVAVVVGVAIASGGESGSVDEVADAAKEAAEDLDVDEAVDLLCEPPTDDQLTRVEEGIEEGKELAGTDDPDLDVAIANEEGDEEGSFELHVTSEDGELAGEEGRLELTVESHDGRSCISDIDIIEEGAG